MTEYKWSDVYDYACKAFGQTPRAEDEADIIQHFERNPAHVIAEIDRIANALSDGKVKYAWSAWAGRIRQNPSPLRDIIVDGATSKARAVENARRWIHNAGCHYDLERDISAELFGDDISRGRLTDHQLSDSEREQLLDYWREQRPRGEQAERNFEAWAEACRQSKAALAAKQTNRKEDEQWMRQTAKAATQGDTCSTTSGSDSSDTPPDEQPNTATTPTTSQPPPTSPPQAQGHQPTPTMTPTSTDSYSGSEPIPDPDADIPTKTPT